MCMIRAHGERKHTIYFSKKAVFSASQTDILRPNIGITHTVAVGTDR